MFSDNSVVKNTSYFMSGIKKEILAQYEMGDICVRYLMDEEKRVALSIVPTALAGQTVMDEQRRIDPLVQVKVAGDAHSTGYSNGTSLRNSATVRHGLTFYQQTTEEVDGQLSVITELRDPRGISAIHVLTGSAQNVLSCDVTVKNGSDETIILEHIESFSLSDLTPFEATDGQDKLSIFRMRAEWQAEGMLEETTPEELLLVPSRKRFAVLSERFGQLGIKPVKKFAPFAAVRDNERGVIWGGMLSIGSSWQIELYRRDNGLAMGGGIADADTGLWIKELGSGESFTAPRGYMTVCEGAIDDITNRFVRYFDETLTNLPASEEDLPIQYNDYRSTIGQPTEVNVLRQAKALAGRGFKYYIIDAGWYLPETGKWYEYSGDWEISKIRFPNGLKPVVEELNKMGFRVGVWVEPDTCGELSDAYNNKTEHLVTRYGKVLTCGRRRFWNLDDPWSWEHLNDKIIGMMKREGLKYIKLDSNESLGAGIDGAESFGEALRKYSLKMEDFYKKITEEIPDAVIENVSAGGARAIYSFTNKSSLTSFSDSFDVPNNPIVSANMLRLIPARQNLIWCILDKTYDANRVYYSLCSATLGRMCLSGDVAALNDEQNRLLDEFIAYYRKCVPAIKKGTTKIYLNSCKNYVAPRGYQAVVRTGDNGDVIVTAHCFEQPYPEKIVVELPSEGYAVSDKFAQEDLSVSVVDNTLVIEGLTQHRALSVFLKKA